MTRSAAAREICSYTSFSVSQGLNVFYILFHKNQILQTLFAVCASESSATHLQVYLETIEDTWKPWKVVIQIFFSQPNNLLLFLLALRKAFASSPEIQQMAQEDFIMLNLVVSLKFEILIKMFTGEWNEPY